MNDWAAKPPAPPPAESPTDFDNDEDRRGSGVIIPMGACATSGFLVGLLCRGEFALAGIALMAVLFCGFVGWWARGVAG